MQETDLAKKVMRLELENAQLRAEVDDLEDKVMRMSDDLGYKLPAPLWLDLTEAESNMFMMLIKNKVCSKEALLNGMCSYRSVDEMPELKIVDVIICRIRKKVAEHGIDIVTVWGSGYAISQEGKNRYAELAEKLGDSL